MRILADENVARDVVAWLRTSGHDVLFAAEARAGAPDIDWAAQAEQEQRVILTSDKDFGELVFRDGLASHGHRSVATRRSDGLRIFWLDFEPFGPSWRPTLPVGSSSSPKTRCEFVLYRWLRSASYRTKKIIRRRETTAILQGQSPNRGR